METPQTGLLPRRRGLPGCAPLCALRSALCALRPAPCPRPRSQLAVRGPLSANKAVLCRPRRCRVVSCRVVPSCRVGCWSATRPRTRRPLASPPRRCHQARNSAAVGPSTNTHVRARRVQQTCACNPPATAWPSEAAGTEWSGRPPPDSLAPIPSCCQSYEYKHEQCLAWRAVAAVTSTCIDATGHALYMDTLWSITRPPPVCGLPIKCPSPNLPASSHARPAPSLPS